VPSRSASPRLLGLINDVLDLLTDYEITEAESGEEALG